MKKIVLLTKQDKFSTNIANLTRSIYSDSVIHYSGNTGSVYPEELNSIDSKWIISFLSPWVIPESILKKNEIAINFHPGSTYYPGTGCYNFALYEEAREYGAVCHFMNKTVDSGEIILEKQFPIFDSDTVESLKLRTLIVMSEMYHEIISKLYLDIELVPSGISWKRKPFTRRELDELMIIKPSMSESEIKKRVRATTYPGYKGPYMVKNDELFYYPVPDREPIA